MRSGRMEKLPHGLRRDHPVELTGRRGEPWVRGLVIVGFAPVVAGALLGAIGQRHETGQAQRPKPR